MLRLTSNLVRQRYILFKNVCIYVFDFSGSLLRQVGSSSLTRDWTLAPVLGARSLSHWTTREVLMYSFFLKKSLLNLLQYCFCFMGFFFFFFFWLGRETFGIFASQPMIEPAPSALEGKVLIPGSPDVFIYHISPDHNHIIIIITMSSPDHNHISPYIFLFKHREMEAQRWLESCSKSRD